MKNNAALRRVVLISGLLMSFNLAAQVRQGERNLVISPPAASVPASSTQRIALVIGNGAYKDAPLANPANDAKAIAAALKEDGFSVTLKENVDIKSMLASIRDFGDQLRKGGVGLFYYAGHGMQIKGRNYLIPVGSAIEREDEVAYAAVDAQAVLDKMDAAGNGTNIMILDACRNNPFVRSFRSAQQGLAQMDAPVGTLVAFATSPGSVASDGNGTNGLYTQHLLKVLREPNLKVEDVFKKVRFAVRRDSQGKQIPWEATSLEGDFYFIPPNGVTESADAALERSMWFLVKDSTQQLDLKAFIARFPQSKYASDAQARLASLESPGKPSAVAGTPPVSGPVGPATNAALVSPGQTPSMESAPIAANALGFKIGDRWSFQVVDKYKGEVIDNWSRKVTKILKNGDWMSGVGVYSPEGNVRYQANDKFISRSFTSANVLIPKKMEIGYKEDFIFRDRSRPAGGEEYEREYKGTLTVKGQETVKVPAGEFLAFRVERNATVDTLRSAPADRRNGREEITYWYVPALHNFVALDSIWRPSKGAPHITRTELTSYEVQNNTIASNP